MYIYRVEATINVLVRGRSDRLHPSQIAIGQISLTAKFEISMPRIGMFECQGREAIR